jgi:hypothetical protein
MDVDPNLIRRSRESLDKGYARLTGFECKQKGYEWFGGDPGHEALTAYGLLEFSDMAKVRQVDADMITRTRDWLLGRRDGKGGFERNERALDSFGRAPQETTNAYIVWALLEAGQRGLDAELTHVIKTALASNDSYTTALGANVAAISGDTSAAAKLMDRLAKAQTADGNVDGAVTSITQSRGQALAIETTALATLAWLRDAAYAGSVEKAIRYLASSCEGGRFGSTQSTVLALRSIVEYDRQRSKPKKAGTLRVFVDDQPIGGPVAFDETTQGAIKLPDLSELLSPGRHTVALKMEGGSEMPYSIAMRYFDVQPASSDECRVALDATLRDTAVREGEMTEAVVTMRNITDEVVPTPVAIIGLPGGLEPRHDQLKELVREGRIDAYEVIGREVVVYWRALRPKQSVEFPISVIAAIPGEYTGPASRAYEYYGDEFKNWVAGMKVTIEPR